MTLSQLRTDMRALFRQALDYAEEDLEPTSIELARNSIRRLEEAEYPIVVIGEFGRGKSSLLNGLVGRYDLFPTDPAVTTAVVTELRHAREPTAVVRFTDGRTGHIDDLRQIAEYVTESSNPGNAKNVARVELGLPLPDLADGLVVIDTPGLGSLNPEHAAATRAELHQAAAVVFVSWAIKPLSALELEFLGEAIARCPVVLPVLTMIDKIADPTPVIDEAHDRIRDTCGLDLDVVATSAFLKRAADETGDRDDLDGSGFPELAVRLWDGLAKAGGHHKLAVEQAELDKMVDTAAAVNAGVLAGIRGDRTVEDYEKRLSAARERAGELHRGSAEWRRDLRQDITDRTRPIKHALMDDFDRLDATFQRNLGEESIVTRYEKVVRDLAVDMVDAGAKADRALMDVAKQLAAEYKARTAIPFVVPTMPDKKLTPNLTDVGVPQVQQQGFLYKQLRHGAMGGNAMVTPGAATGAAIGFFIGTVPGAIVGGAIGSLVGKAVGWGIGVRHADEEKRRNDRRTVAEALRRQVTPRISSVRRQAEENLKDRTQRLRDHLIETLDQEIKAQVENTEAAIERLAKARATSAGQRTERLRELSERAEGYRLLKDAVAAMSVRVDALTGE